jgi:hypothetical protein
MLAYTRELFMDRLLEMPSILKEFDDTGQVENLVNWLTTLEEEVGKLRNPLATSVTTTITSIQNCWEGQLIEGIQESMPKRKARKIAVKTLFGRLGESMSNEVENIDSKFEVMSDKIAQLLGAASAIKPLPMPDVNLQRWKRNVWIELGKHESTKAIYTYLTSSLNKSDREYLLDSMLGRLADNNA